MLRAPVTFVRSAVAVGVLLISYLYEPLVNDRLPPIVRAPGLLPGESVPPLTVTLPAIDPLPPSVPPLTRTSPAPVPLPAVLFTKSVPAVTVVPVWPAIPYVFAPDNVRM